MKSWPSDSYSTGFHPIPDSEAEPAAGEQVDLGRLLGDERCLALGEDHDAGGEFERRARREEAEQHERLVELGVDVIRAVPVLIDLRIRAQDVVVGDQVCVPELLDSPAVGADGRDVRPDLGLWKHDSDPHRTEVLQAPERTGSDGAAGG